jgi:hypothetical protein
MRFIIGALYAWLLGTAGWWLGARLSLIAAVLLSVFGASIGLYLGYRWFDRNLK